jgi:farnesyl-diphosphate farnesyltransferase
MSNSTPVGPNNIEWCHGILQEVSRTFAVSIAQLEDPMEHEICIGYLLCRVADTIEDAEHIPPAEKARLFDTYSDVLSTDETVTVGAFTRRAGQWIPTDHGADWRLLSETPRLIAAFTSLPAATQAVIRPQIKEMLAGMSEFVTRYADTGGLRIKTVAELERYCWYVAGTVGNLVTGLVTRDAPDGVAAGLAGPAESFGLLLQLVNVIKDIATDYEQENNVYVPEAILEKHGLKPADIPDSANGDRFKPVVRELVSEAEQHIAQTRAWLESMPRSRGNTLSAWAVPFLLAVGTLRELKQRPADVITEGDVKVSRTELFGIVDAFQGDEDPELDRLQRRVQAR